MDGLVPAKERERVKKKYLFGVVVSVTLVQAHSVCVSKGSGDMWTRSYVQGDPRKSVHLGFV